MWVLPFPRRIRSGSQEKEWKLEKTDRGMEGKKREKSKLKVNLKSESGKNSVNG